MHQILVVTFILFSTVGLAQMKTDTIKFGQEVELAECSFRGAAVAHNMALVSGSNGIVFKAQLNTKPLQWRLLKIPKSDTLQFRDVTILNQQTILLMSAGEGKSAQIWKSNDAGSSWTKVYQNLLDKAFFNGFDFWNDKEGVLISDPIDSYVYLLQTNDGGSTWQRIQSTSLPVLKGKEYGFAASGTGLQCFGNGKIRLGTGGAVARIFSSDDYGENWKVEETPILQGKASQGIFSIDYLNKKQAIAVGGDYANDTIAGSNIIQLNEKWLVKKAAQKLKFKSCVKYLGEDIILTTGTSGTSISYDAGESWAYIEKIKGYHTIAFDKTVNKGFMAGSDGRVLEFWLE